MAGDYKKLWDEAKKRFEKEAGKAIADREKANDAREKKKISELSVNKKGVAKLKKPAETFGWSLGLIRKSSEMEPACKRLDKAADAKKPNEQDKTKAYKDYEKDRIAYQRMLDAKANDKNSVYNSVKPEIKELGRAMEEIGEKFRLTIKAYGAARSRLITDANKLIPYCKEMGAYLDRQRGDDDWPGEKGYLGKKYGKTVREEGERIMEKKLIPGLEALHKLAVDEGFLSVDFGSIARHIYDDRIAEPITESDMPFHIRYWFYEFEKDIQSQIDRLTKNS